MKHASLAKFSFALLGVSACAAPRAGLPSTSNEAVDPGVGVRGSSLALRFADHLSFGARLEHVDVLLDGVTAYEADGPSSPRDARVTLRPGPHTLAVVLRASEPCGLLDEPRTRVVVEATTALSTGEGPGSLTIDVYGAEATSDALRTLGVRFQSRDVRLGGEPDRPPRGCDRTDTLCSIDALADAARARRDFARVACIEEKRARARELADVVDDSYATVKRGGTTSGEAEKAQLRARYAEERIRAIVVSADACGARIGGPLVAGAVRRTVERVCPGPDATAGAEPLALP